MRRRRKQGNFQRIGDILPKVFKKKKLYIHLEDRHISNAWKKAVGSIISAKTRAYKLKDGTLLVKVSTSTWMQQLQFMKEEIKEKVNAGLEKESVKNIYFSIGIIGSASPKDKHGIITDIGQYPLKERDKKLIEKSLTSIADEELKNIIKGVMVKELTNRRFQEDEKSRLK